MPQIVDAFHTAYEREYTYRLPAAVELVGLHLVASAEVGKLMPTDRPVTGATLADARKDTRSVNYALDGVHDAAIYDGEKLEPGMALTGPAIIEDPGTTVVVHPGDRLTVDRYGNLHLDIA